MKSIEVLLAVRQHIDQNSRLRMVYCRAFAARELPRFRTALGIPTLSQADVVDALFEHTGLVPSDKNPPEFFEDLMDLPEMDEFRASCPKDMLPGEYLRMFPPPTDLTVVVHARGYFATFPGQSDLHFPIPTPFQSRNGLLACTFDDMVEAYMTLANAFRDTWDPAVFDVPTFWSRVCESPCFSKMSPVEREWFTMCLID